MKPCTIYVPSVQTADTLERFERARLYVRSQNVQQLRAAPRWPPTS